MAAKNHTHKYRRAIGRITEKNKDSKFIGYYKCVLPDCTHYNKAELILGKESICNRCHVKFVLPMAVAMLTNSPHCKKCTKVNPKIKKEEELDRMEEAFLEMEIE